MNLLKSLSSNGKRGRGPKKAWTLGEVLSVMYMLDQDDMEKAEIAKIIGRTVHQIQYHILENPIMDGNKKKRRSFKAKYIVDAASPEEAYTNLFAHFDLEYEGIEDINKLITEFHQSLQEASQAAG